MQRVDLRPRTPSTSPAGSARPLSLAKEAKFSASRPMNRRRVSMPPTLTEVVKPRPDTRVRLPPPRDLTGRVPATKKRPLSAAAPNLSFPVQACGAAGGAVRRRSEAEIETVPRREAFRGYRARRVFDRQEQAAELHIRRSAEEARHRRYNVGLLPRLLIRTLGRVLISENFFMPPIRPCRSVVRRSLAYG